ncbi:MAG: sialidase family protein [Promethearchaeota archaeon]
MTFEPKFNKKLILTFRTCQFLLVFLFVVLGTLLLYLLLFSESLLCYENIGIIVITLIMLFISSLYTFITSILTIKKKRPIKIRVKKVETTIQKFEDQKFLHAFIAFFNIIVSAFFFYFSIFFTFYWSGVTGLGIEIQIIVLIILYGQGALYLGTSLLWIGRFIRSIKKPIKVKLTKGMMGVGLIFLFLISSIGVSLLISTIMPKWSPGLINRQELFKTGETYEGPEGEPPIKGYRIPSLLWLPRDVLLAFAEARHEPWDDGGNIDIVLRRSLDGGDTWEPLQIVAEYGNHTAGNPCPVYDEDTRTVFLIYNRDNKEVWVTKSHNKGVSWSTPQKIKGLGLTGSFHGCGPGVGIQKKKVGYIGRLIIPAYGGGQGGCHIIYSDDHGSTWHVGGSTGCGGEPQVVEDFLGGLYMNMRGSPNRIIARSGDGGITWSECYSDPALPDVPCQASVYRLTSIPTNDKNRILYSGPNYRVRGYYTIRMSYDEGITWPVAKEIYAGSSAYGQMVVLSDHTIVLLFECGEVDYREGIQFVKFDIDWLTDGQDQIK